MAWFQGMSHGVAPLSCRQRCGITDMGRYARRFCHIHQVSSCSCCFTAAVVMEETPVDHMQSHQLQATMSDIVNETLQLYGNLQATTRERDELKSKLETLTATNAQLQQLLLHQIPPVPALPTSFGGSLAPALPTSPAPSAPTNRGDSPVPTSAGNWRIPSSCTSGGSAAITRSVAPAPPCESATLVEEVAVALLSCIAPHWRDCLEDGMEVIVTPAGVHGLGVREHH